MDLAKEIDLCLRSRYTLLVVVSFEEERVVEELEGLCEESQRKLLLWDHADHFQLLVGEGEKPAARDPITALEAIEKMDGQAVFLLRDFHQCWANQPRVIRKLRNLAQELKYSHKSIIVTMPTLNLPEELRDAAVEIECPLPDLSGMDRILTELLESPGARAEMSDDGRERLLRAALGLSTNQAQRAFSKAIVTRGVLEEDDLEQIIAKKKQVIARSGALEFYTPDEGAENVGGLGALKKWLSMRERAFSKEARDYGLPAPKGIALVGIPGTGKSLTAKAVAAMWRLPLIRLDMGALFGSLVGQSEENTRRALQLAETIAPCLLWIDEIEKGLSVGDGDGGTSMRVFGTILSWMQERKKPVFTIATANNIAMLPPELLRRGRFDEIFFLDLPTFSERREIISVHIRKRGRDPAAFDVDRIAAAAEGFVGAEIEQAVIDAMYLAFNDEQSPHREFTTFDVLKSLQRLIPLSISQREVVKILRDWLADGRAQTASLPETDPERRGPVAIPLEPQR